MTPEPVVLSIVVPVFDEEANLVPLAQQVDAVRGLLPPLELVLVDDGSRDGSWERIRELSARFDWVRGIRFLGNRGQTAAMAAGIEESRGTLVAFLDADLQNDPEDLPALLAPVAAGEADLACGWRANRRDPSATRVWPSRVANAIVRRSLGLALHDVGCTLRVGRRSFLEDLPLEGEMHRFLPAWVAAQGARIVERPVNHRPRVAGKSKYGLDRVWKVLLDLLTAKMLNAYGSKPAYFFGKIAFVLGLLGTAALGLVAWRVLVLRRLEATPMVFVMTLLYVAALLSLFSGLLAEINVRVLHRIDGRRPWKVVDRTGAPPPTTGG